MTTYTTSRDCKLVAKATRCLKINIRGLLFALFEIYSSKTDNVQLLTFAYIWLLNKPYENEVTLTGENPPLK